MYSPRGKLASNTRHKLVLMARVFRSKICAKLYRSHEKTNYNPFSHHRDQVRLDHEIVTS